MKKLLVLLIVLGMCVPVYGLRMVAGTTNEYVYFIAVDSTDLHTRETGFSSFTVYYSIGSGSGTAMTSPTIAETDNTNMPGVYDLLIDEGGMTTMPAGDDTIELCLHITHAGMDPVTRVIEIYRPDTTAGHTLTVTNGVGNSNIMQVYTVNIPEPNRAGYPDVCASFVGDVPARPITRANIVADATTGAGAAIDPNMIIVLAELAEADANNAAILAATCSYSGGVASATGATVVFDSGPVQTADYYNRCLVTIISGTGAGQTRHIHDWATLTASIIPNWITNPAADSVADILPYGEVHVHKIHAEGLAQINAEVDTAISDAGLAPLRSTTVASATSTSSFTLTAGKQSVNAYLYHTIAITDAGDSNVEERVIIGYSAGRVCLVDRPFSFLPAGSDVARISLGSYFIPKKGVR